MKARIRWPRILSDGERQRITADAEQYVGLHAERWGASDEDRERAIRKVILAVAGVMAAVKRATPPTVGRPR